MAYDHNTFDSEMSPEREKTFYLRESFARLLKERINELAEIGWKGYADMYEMEEQNLYDVIRLAYELLKIEEEDSVQTGWLKHDSLKTVVSFTEIEAKRLDELIEEAVKKADYLKLKAQFEEVK